MKIINDNTDLVIAEAAKQTAILLDKIGQGVEDCIPLFCPVKTGATRDSRGHVVEIDKVTIGVMTTYAPFIEAGSVKMPPRPFLKQSLFEFMNSVKE